MWNWGDSVHFGVATGPAQTTPSYIMLSILPVENTDPSLCVYSLVPMPSLPFEISMVAWGQGYTQLKTWEAPGTIKAIILCAYMCVCVCTYVPGVKSLVLRRV